ncbi:hypothetical protein DFLDMN_001503 [Cupriavidus sp. H19C3]
MRLLMLWALVVLNYWKRRHGLAPDVWYWADTELMERGYWVDERYLLRRWRIR